MAAAKSPKIQAWITPSLPTAMKAIKRSNPHLHQRGLTNVIGIPGCFGQLTNADFLHHYQEFWSFSGQEIDGGSPLRQKKNSYWDMVSTIPSFAIVLQTSKPNRSIKMNGWAFWVTVFLYSFYNPAAALCRNTGFDIPDHNRAGSLSKSTPSTIGSS